jgi:hypothetical protein
MASERGLLFQVTLVCATAFAFAGCSGSGSGSQALNQALTNAGKDKVPVFPLAGVITVDGQPPAFPKPSDRLIVMLNDAAAPAASDKKRLHTTVGRDGHFQFGTYTAADGVPVGKYVLEFAMLRKKGEKGTLLGPDELKNLYNDPEKNVKVEQFVIDQKAPGKSDYKFDLKLAGQEAAEPGPKALTEMH